MKPCNAFNAKDGHQSNKNGATTLFCKLFSDIVPEQLCLVRRRELNRKGCFSCSGCTMDVILNERQDPADHAPSVRDKKK